MNTTEILLTIITVFLGILVLFWVILLAIMIKLAKNANLMSLQIKKVFKDSEKSIKFLAPLITTIYAVIKIIEKLKKKL